MDISLLINSSGLLFDIVGAIVMYTYSQKVSFGTYLYSAEHIKKMQARAVKMNRRIKLGAMSLFFGFLLQLAASWMV